MKFGSLFSGIEAASAAWLPLGWSCAWVAEIDPFACAVLRQHYPNIPNLGDVNRIDGHAVEPVDLVVFGSPCQSFSVAGKRLGLDDPRGNMALVGLRLIGRIRPRWVVWENVPGVLSSDNGRDFGAFLGLLGELGYGFAYRILDAQHAGVPQRRRRVFVVGCLGDWRGAAAVLFEPESLRGDSPPRRETGQDAPAGAGDGSAYSCRPNTHDAAWRGDGADNFVAAFGGNNTSGPIDVATACNSHGGPSGRLDFETETLIAHALRADGFDASEDGTGRGTPLVAVTFDHQVGGSERTYIHDKPGRARALTANKTLAVMTLAIRGRGDRKPGQGYPAAMQGMSVRRLTPVECERLQGFPDGYTDVPYRGKPASDGPRYRAVGNSMAVPVVAWLGRRIQQFTEQEATDAE